MIPRKKNVVVIYASTSYVTLGRYVRMAMETAGTILVVMVSSAIKMEMKNGNPAVQRVPGVEVNMLGKEAHVEGKIPTSVMNA